MKGSCGIKKLYGGAGRGYRSAGRICHDSVTSFLAPSRIPSPR